MADATVQSNHLSNEKALLLKHAVQSGSVDNIVKTIISLPELNSIILEKNDSYINDTSAGNNLCVNYKDHCYAKTLKENEHSMEDINSVNIVDSARSLDYGKSQDHIEKNLLENSSEAHSIDNKKQNSKGHSILQNLLQAKPIKNSVSLSLTNKNLVLKHRNIDVEHSENAKNINAFDNHGTCNEAKISLNSSISKISNDNNILYLLLVNGNDKSQSIQGFQKGFTQRASNDDKKITKLSLTSSESRKLDKASQKNDSLSSSNKASELMFSTCGTIENKTNKYSRSSNDVLNDTRSLKELLCVNKNESHSKQNTLKSEKNTKPIDKKNFCWLCNKHFPSKRYLQLHNKAMHFDERKRRYECEVCYTKYNCKEAYLWHVNDENKKYPCLTCKQEFSHCGDLREHQLAEGHSGIIRRDNAKHLCPICGKLFSRESVLDIHVRVHDGKKPYICSHCPKTFYSEHVLKNHEEKHTKGKQFKCSWCEMCFYAKDDRKKHEATHSGVKPFKCVKCDKAFLRAHALTLHMRTHTGEKPYSCQYCAKRFGARTTLTMHLTTHVKNYNYKCDICDKKFYLSVQLKEHKLMHENVRFQCEFCPKIFKTKRYYYGHKRIHKTKPFTCIQCLAHFKTDLELQEHKYEKHDAVNVIEEGIVVVVPDQFAQEQTSDQLLDNFNGNTEVIFETVDIYDIIKHPPPPKVFKCFRCNEEFKSKTKYLIHKRLHSGKGVETCNICGKNFANFSNLKKHIPSHSAEKPFKCIQCPSAFKSNEALERHSNKFHFPGKYACKYCFCKFNFIKTYDSHLRMHNVRYKP